MMSAQDILSRVDEILGRLGDTDWVAVGAFDGVVFKEDMENGNAWDMFPRQGALAVEQKFRRKGHRPFFNSARGMGEIRASEFGKIRNIGLSANSGLHEGFRGLFWDWKPDFGPLRDYVEGQCGTFPDVCYHVMGCGFAVLFWREGHQAADAIKKAVADGIKDGLVEDWEGFGWKVVEEKDGIYLDWTGGATKGDALCGYLSSVQSAFKRIGLVVARGKSKSDAAMVRVAGDSEYGIGLWAGDEADMPKGSNVFKVRDEDEMAEIWDKIVEELPDRNAK